MKGVEGRGGDGAKNYVQMFLKQDREGFGVGWFFIKVYASGWQ